MQGLRAAGFARNPVPAGRTDAGVHARMQVLVMRLVEQVKEVDVAARLNEKLPPDVGIALSRPAPPRFHPQWKARAKEYRYRLALKEWRVDFRAEGRALTVEAIATGYGPRDLATSTDPRVAVHRAFVARFGDGGC